MKPNRTLRCAIYTRKSTEEGLEQAFNSLDAQREACDAYVKSQAGEGWVALPTLYDDGGYSGGNMERPALKALLADIDRGLVDIVVVYKVDRLTRSLADFGKIVERFDRRGASFVSVTQAFNTTNSMGRLTLNMLLSFAQFEREVTSERIRDKLAASRRKGMWMGGRPPFGYRVVDKKIYPDPEEAPLVRGIFFRYLELGSVRLLKQELEDQGVISKPWISRHGHANGGKSFDRGALYHLLQNRLYIGEIKHKDERHKGQHEGIVAVGLFDKVQARLAEGSQRDRGPTATAFRRPLVGLIWDERGIRMSPSYTVKDGKRYPYYVSRRALTDGANANPLRVPAEPVEDLVLDRMERLLGSNEIAALVPSLIERIEIGAHAILIRLRSAQLMIELERLGGRQVSDDLARLQQRLEPTDRLGKTGEYLDLVIDAGATRRGGATTIERPDSRTPVDKPRSDPALLKGIARAHGWVSQMLSGEAGSLRDIAKREGMREGYVRRQIVLAFLSPDTLAEVLKGRQASSLTVDMIARNGLPLSWQPIAA